MDKKTIGIFVVVIAAFIGGTKYNEYNEQKIQSETIRNAEALNISEMRKARSDIIDIIIKAKAVAASGVSYNDWNEFFKTLNVKYEKYQYDYKVSPKEQASFDAVLKMMDGVQRVWKENISNSQYGVSFCHQTDKTYFDSRCFTTMAEIAYGSGYITADGSMLYSNKNTDKATYVLKLKEEVQYKIKQSGQFDYVAELLSQFDLACSGYLTLSKTDFQQACEG